MPFFLGAALLLSLVVILTGYLVDRSAVKARVNGANGLPILAALVVSFAGSLVVAILAGFLGGWAMLGWVLLFTIPYHAGLGVLLIGRLQRLATRASQPPAAARR